MKLLASTWNIGKVNGAWYSEDLHEMLITIPRHVRNRLNAFGNVVTERLNASLLALHKKENIFWVASCRHGDAKRTEQLLIALANREMLSPIDFSMSVHNAIIGMFSIATQNNQSNTALSGGSSSFTAGLIEAYALQKVTNDIVGYVYYDTNLSSKYQNIIEETMLERCIVLLLAPANVGTSANDNIRLTYCHDTNCHDTNTKQQNDVEISLLDFLSNREKKLDIFVYGGQICFERY